MLTALMDLQAPPAATVAPRFHRLFAATAPDVSARDGKIELLTGFKGTLQGWAATLRKFLQDEDDQFELLITLEEYCLARGLFGGQRGALYVPIFSNVLMQLYEADIMAEDVFAKWERAKLDDDDEDQARPACAHPMRCQRMQEGPVCVVACH
jgi:eIF4-gamma/eIF5/eIF2-epsilon